jgi:hypothetical protein
MIYLNVYRTQHQHATRNSEDKSGADDFAPCASRLQAFRPWRFAHRARLRAGKNEVFAAIIAEIADPQDGICDTVQIVFGMGLSKHCCWHDTSPRCDVNAAPVYLVSGGGFRRGRRNPDEDQSSVA